MGIFASKPSAEMERDICDEFCLLRTPTRRLLRVDCGLESFTSLSYSILTALATHSSSANFIFLP